MEHLSFLLSFELLWFYPMHFHRIFLKQIQWKYNYSNFVCNDTYNKRLYLLASTIVPRWSPGSVNCPIVRAYYALRWISCCWLIVHWSGSLTLAASSSRYRSYWRIWRIGTWSLRWHRGWWCWTAYIFRISEINI